jgi:hypothetical protein
MGTGTDRKTTLFLLLPFIVSIGATLFLIVGAAARVHNQAEASFVHEAWVTVRDSLSEAEVVNIRQSVADTGVTFAFDIIVHPEGYGGVHRLSYRAHCIRRVDQGPLCLVFPGGIYYTVP